MKRAVTVLLFAAVLAISASAQSSNPGIPIDRILRAGGRLDVDALRASSYQGSINAEGFNLRLDPKTGEPYAVPSGATGGASDPDDVYWEDHGFGFQGTNGVVYGLVVYNGQLIVGGSFSHAGNTPANNVAAWNGSSWTSLGSGINSSVFALAVYDGKLIAGGYFSTAGGLDAHGIAAWDGNSWLALGSGMGGTSPGSYPLVRSLTIFDGKLIAGGDFITAGGVSASRIAVWDGSAWSALGSGIGGTNVQVSALTVYDGKLIVGGYFETAGGVTVNNIAAWDGSSWSSLGTGTEGDANASPTVYALTTYDNKLIAGGGFIAVGGVSASRIAAWDGSSWSALGSGMEGIINITFVHSLIVYDYKLVAGGTFHEAGGVSSNAIAAWNGSSWTSMNSEYVYLQGVSALAIFDGELIAGGAFTSVDNVDAYNIASWDAVSWSPLCLGINGWVYALSVFDDKLIVGGEFTVIGGVPANGIAAWDGNSWLALGSGMDYRVSALAVYGGKLIAGGNFSVAGGVSANMIAAWDGAQWSALGSGMNGVVHSLAVYDGKLIAGGNFFEAGGNFANYVAFWNGSSWSPLGSGLNGYVTSLVVWNNMLVVGGSFNSADGNPTVNIAAWDGYGWDSYAVYANSMDGSFGVSALAVYEGLLVAGGDFNQVDGVTVNHVAAWNGSNWSALGSGTDGGGVNRVSVYCNKLIVGGNFNTAGEVNAKDIAAWDGSMWYPLGSGTYGSPLALALYEGKLVVGGYLFTAGDKVSAGLAIWGKNPLIVANLDDEGFGSFHMAIDTATVWPTNDSIIFSVSGTIELQYPLPQVIGADQTTILGSTAPDGAHSVIIDGSNLTSGDGLVFNCETGSHTYAEGLVVTGFSGKGVVVRNHESDPWHVFSNNLIYGNGGLGIDIGDDGVTVNDYPDNDYVLNYPDIDSVVWNPDSTFTVYGRTADTSQVVEFYVAHPAGDTARPADPSGHGPAYEFIGADTSDFFDPNQGFVFDIPLSVPRYSSITATTTSFCWYPERSSEFCPNFTLVPSPLIVKAISQPGGGKRIPPSVVNLWITDPNGNFIGRDSHGNLSQTLSFADYDQEPPSYDDSVTIHYPLAGEYIIEVLAEDGAQPGDLYTVNVRIDGSQDVVLADDIEVPLVGLPPDSIYYVVEEGCDYLNGDANGSGGDPAIDIDDVVFLITYVFAGGAEPQPLLSGDADCSVFIDIDDIVYLIGYIFAGAAPPCQD